jgi:hypothetical protein
VRKVAISDDDEQPGATMGRSGVGCSNNSPPRIPPHAGKVSENIGKAQSEVTSDVFQHCISGSYCAKGISDVWPEVAFIVLAFPKSCMAERLAGIAAGDDINRLHLRPVHGGDVAKVWHVRVQLLQHCAGCGLNLGVPRQVTTDGHVEAAVSAKQAADPHATRPKLFSKWA